MIINFINEPKGHRIRKRFRVKFDTDSRVFSILPAVDFQLWSDRTPRTFVFVFRWLHLRIGCWVWERRKEVM